MDKCQYKLISQTKNGKVFRCTCCNTYNIEYKNLNFNFKKEDFIYFIAYFEKLEPEMWEYVNRNAPYCRKILVPIGHKNFTAMFHKAEIYELKQLFRKIRKGYKGTELIELKEIETSMCLN